MTNRFHIVDVFAEEKYAGNQLAVVTDADDLTGDEMQTLAAEMDYSETTFVTGPPADDAWPVRIFTPAEEVPFAGHPTLGTAAVIREHLVDAQPDSITLDLGVGKVPVETRRRDGQELFWMHQQPPDFGETITHEKLATVLGLEPEALDRSWPVQVVSTGLPTIIVPLASRAALAAIDLDREVYDDLVADRDAKLVHAVCRESRDPANDLAVRMFAPYYDVPEDPATGSANGCLAAYLSRHEVFGSASVDVRAEQGYEMGRPSLLSLRAEESADGIDVEVGGRVIPTAMGRFV